MNPMQKSLWKTIQMKTKETIGDDFWNDLSNVLPAQGPRIDVYQTQLQVIVLVELPGLATADPIKVALTNHTLHLSGEIPPMDHDPDEDMMISERFHGPFQRKIALPEDISSEGINAQLRNGLLRIEIAKTAGEIKCTDIQIEYGG